MPKNNTATIIRIAPPNIKYRRLSDNHSLKLSKLLSSLSYNNGALSAPQTHLKGIEPPHMVPETTALSTELQTHFQVSSQIPVYHNTSDSRCKVFNKNIHSLIFFILRYNLSLFCIKRHDLITFLLLELVFR